mmetsp:Transcript_15193/g.22998  ORF Transcript_15193/g.22998 Transcript_15193/m.22998 type:complete len:258 (+) Transcript_15193:50-823(+)|eukprot:CAMPEP_0167753156 /NCGR_PEP_ID=MMETSP0110_2-20121227/7549_1 /TAXON_ID=629695 /ORGANISM="Gymnochlora sp., Strain CCMP2014" /LENGTH=257 /DNA_ID=CAMNT_0007638875 /DNA_START=11 /DNA_END=784 /DNA_ORIENTATION=+
MASVRSLLRVRHFAKAIAASMLTAWVCNARNARAWKQKDKSTWDSNWDGRDDSGSKVVHTIVLVRHGQYIHAKDDEGRKLTEKGREQAKITGKRLQDLEAKGTIPPIKYMIYSTMTRATETYNIIAKELNNDSDRSIQPSFLIREGAVYPPEPPSLTWKPTPAAFKEDGKRIENGYKEYIHRAPPEEESNYSTLLVCHGNVIRYFFMRALQLPPERWLSLAVNNASISIIRIYPSGNVSCTAVGDVGHFDPEMITYN